MSIIEIKTKKNSHAREICIQCDTCNKRYTTWYRKSYLIRKNYFCSYGCSGESRRKGNVLFERTKKTMLELYGVANPSQAEVIKQKKKTTLLKNYGVTNPRFSKEIEKRRIKTLKENYGVDNPLKSEEIKNKINFLNNWVKAHNTKKKNGGYNRRSKIEIRFEKALKLKYENIETSVIINNSEIDFYIKDINTYVQFDGVYWHGLDRPLPEIKKSSKQRDFNIIKTFIRDRKQDKWFANNNKRLIRITDMQFKKLITKGREHEACVLLGE